MSLIMTDVQLEGIAKASVSCEVGHKLEINVFFLIVYILQHAMVNSTVFKTLTFMVCILRSRVIIREYMLHKLTV